MIALPTCLVRHCAQSWSLPVRRAPWYHPSSIVQYRTNSRNIYAKNFSFFLFGLALLFGLAGCNLFVRSEEATATPISAAPTAVRPITTLTMAAWQSAAESQERLRRALDAALQLSPALTVTLTFSDDYDNRLRQLLVSDLPPDIILLDAYRFPDVVSAGLLQPIGEQLDNPADFYPIARQMFTYQGEFYCAPRELNTLAVIYNQTLFEKKKVAPPTGEWSWTELRSALGQVNDVKAAVTGLALSADLSRWLPFLYQAGASLTDPAMTEFTVNSPQALAAVNFLDQISSDGFSYTAEDLDGSWPGESFGKQRAAMIFEGAWALPYLEQNFPDVIYNVAELPRGAAGQATIAFSSCYAVPAKAPNAAAAIHIINDLTGDVGMTAWVSLGDRLPARASLSERFVQRFPNRQPFVAGVAYARPWQFFPGFDQALTGINNDLQLLYKAVISSEEFLQYAVEHGKDALQAQ